MNILDEIVTHKKDELILKKQYMPIQALEQLPFFERKCLSISDSVHQSRFGIIAEHKRRSPSKPVINNGLSVSEVVVGYQSAGVSGISVLTDSRYFGGSLEDLSLARASVNMPLLRKEFIVDEYQIVEAKAYGTDFILLIAAILTPEQIQSYSSLAQSLGMETLLEVHNEDEIEKSIAVMEHIHIIGVNNRNLKTFTTSVDTSKELSTLIPSEKLKISESGIYKMSSILELQEYGYHGFLIGDNFMRTNNPGAEVSKFLQEN